MNSRVFKAILNFCLYLLVIIGVVFIFHNKLTGGQDLAVLSYGVNIALAIAIFSALSILKENKSEILGFVFMVGSGLKFGAYFLLFHSDFKADGRVDKAEFALFFIPYAVCLIVEVLFLLKLLKK